VPIEPKTGKQLGVIDAAGIGPQSAPGSINCFYASSTLNLNDSFNTATYTGVGYGLPASSEAAYFGTGALINWK